MRRSAVWEASPFQGERQLESFRDLQVVTLRWTRFLIR